MGSLRCVAEQSCLTADHKRIFNFGVGTHHDGAGSRTRSGTQHLVSTDSLLFNEPAMTLR